MAEFTKGPWDYLPKEAQEFFKTWDTNGGPFHPFERSTTGGVVAHDGISLRDWFAGQVLAGDIGGLANTAAPKQCAEYAYALADAMLAARSALNRAEGREG